MNTISIIFISKMKVLFEIFYWNMLFNGCRTFDSGLMRYLIIRTVAYQDLLINISVCYRSFKETIQRVGYSPA